MFTANLSSIDSAGITLSNAAISIGLRGLKFPALAAYSPIPSLQAVATQHAAAITGSSGSATLVSAAIGQEIGWAATNLRSLSNVVEKHEESVAKALQSVEVSGGAPNIGMGMSAIAGTFDRRPPFYAGTLTFTPAMVSGEIGLDATTLLSMFNATNDAAVGDAIAYWAEYAAAMGTLAAEITSAAGQLTSANSGMVFDAASATLAGLAARTTNVATSASTLSAHLQVLPAVKAMAINTLSTIEAQAALIEDPLAREQFERAEITAFLTGPYNAQLQAAVPTISNLTQPDLGGGVPSIATAGITTPLGNATAQYSGPAGMNGATNTASALTTPTTNTPTPNPVNSTTPTPHLGTTPATTNAPTTPPSPTPSLGSTTPTTNTGTTPRTSTTMPTPTQPGAIMPMNQTSTASTRTTPATTRPTITPGNLSNRSTGANAATITGNRPPHGPSTRTPHPRGLTTPTPTTQSITPRGTTANPGTITGQPLRNATNTPTTSIGNTGNTNTGNRANTPTTSPHATMHNNNAHNAKNPHGSAVVNSGGRAGNERRNAKTHTIHGNNTNTFEQSEYQRELFGDTPTTVPAIIGGTTTTR